MKTKFMLAALAAAVAAPALAQTLPPPVIIIVDSDRVLSESAAGKVALAELKTKNDAIQARVASARTQFGTEGEALQKQVPAQGAAPAVVQAFQAKANDFDKRRQAAEADIQKRASDLQIARQYAIKQINDAAQPVITAIMRERGATIVLPEGATLQHASSLDVTADVLARLDKALPRVSTTPPAAPAK